MWLTSMQLKVPVSSGILQVNVDEGQFAEEGEEG